MSEREYVLEADLTRCPRCGSLLQADMNVRVNLSFYRYVGDKADYDFDDWHDGYIGVWCENNHHFGRFTSLEQAAKSLLAEYEDEARKAVT